MTKETNKRLGVYKATCLSCSESSPGPACQTPPGSYLLNAVQCAAESGFLREWQFDNFPETLEFG